MKRLYLSLSALIVMASITGPVRAKNPDDLTMFGLLNSATSALQVTFTAALVLYWAYKVTDLLETITQPPITTASRVEIVNGKPTITLAIEIPKGYDLATSNELISQQIQEFKNKLAQLLHLRSSKENSVSKAIRLQSLMGNAKHTIVLDETDGRGTRSVVVQFSLV